MRGLGLYILAGAALALPASGQPNSPAEAGKPRAASWPEATALWSVATQDDQGKVTKTVLICADAAVHRSFSRPLPSPNGAPCVLIGSPVEDAVRFAARCKAGTRHFNIQAAKAGDPDKDFGVKLLVRSDAPGSVDLVQSLHYRRLGDCPTGWSAGDSATPGDRRVVNSLSGVSRVVSSPIRPPAP